MTMAALLRITTFLLLLLVAAFPGLDRAAAQDNPKEIIVSVAGGAPEEEEEAAPESYLNGYHSSLDGQVLLYHSAHPDAEAALIVRANSAAHSATWLTDTIPPHSSDGMLQFIWLSGLERAGWGESKNGHAFDFFVNGERYFTFRNYKDATAPHWSLKRPDGSELSFTARMTDKFGDQFGYMVLRLPGEHFESGKPLTLRVVGENANSPEWYMTFQYRFTFTPRVRVEPALFRNSAGATQVLRLSLDNLEEGKTVEISTTEGMVRKEELKVGANIFQLPIPAVDKAAPRTLVFRVNQEETLRQEVVVNPVIRREIYLLPHSHNDIGYTDIQPEVRKKQWRNIDEALRLIALTRNYPSESRFRWNIEVLWPLESYYKEATQERREELVAAVRSGSLGLNALYANVLTGLATSTEMSHFTDFARAFSRWTQVPITTALVSDIPGFTWGIVPALAQSGVRYFASGPNSGDRIGYVLEQWGDKPFYWISQSGKEKVLFWVAGAGYSTFHEGTLAKLGDEKLMKLMRRIDESGYPYSIVHLPYTQGDNGPPDSTLSDYVRRWNQTYESPRLIIATHAQMFEEFEKRYGSSLPVHAGDFTPYWEDGAISTAFETALNRQAVDRLGAGEALWSMRSPGAYPEKQYFDAWRNVVLYDEHTWGADKSVSDPDLPGVKEQWRIKRQFALDADSLSRLLVERALAASRRRNSDVSAIEVYNTSGNERSGLVIVPRGLSLAGDRVLDGRGRALPTQRLLSGELAFMPAPLQPLSSTKFSVRKGKFQRGSSAPPPANVLENDRIRLSVNPATGAIREFLWKAGNVNLATPGRGLNEYIYVPGTNPDSATFLSNVTVQPGEAGPLVWSIVIRGDAPGCRWYQSELRLFKGSDRVEIVTTFDKIAVREKEAIHVAFPLAVPGGEIRYDVANAIVRPEADQLAGGCKNFFSVRSWVDISNKEYGVTLATPDAPLVEFGSITAEKPWLRSAATTGPIYSYVMNNYWHTNYKADQEGVMSLRYLLLPHGAYSPGQSAAFGAEARQPLILSPADAQPLPPLFRLGAGVMIESVKPLAANQWLIYAYNPTGSDLPVNVSLRGWEAVAVSWSDPDGIQRTPFAAAEKLPAHGSAYILVEKK